MLIIEIPNELILDIKSIGRPTIDSGTYLYVGSAMGEGSTSLEKRIQRHFRQDKKLFWHIDYLLKERATLKSVIWSESLESVECELAHGIKQIEDMLPGPRGFGSTDCRSSCSTHLFCTNRTTALMKRVKEVFLHLGLTPLTTYDGRLQGT